ncbi:hypothetical protein ACHAXS_003525 [Conticribra weissflogii]
MTARSLSTRKGSKGHERSWSTSTTPKKILGCTVLIGFGILFIFHIRILLYLNRKDPPTPPSAADKTARDSLEPNDKRSRGSSALGATTRQCTPDQLSIIETQLPPTDCRKHVNSPWTQRCSFSYATQCPDAMWLDELYQRRHRERRKSETTVGGGGGSFTAIFVGCNKGMDAVDTMRMGSGNPTFDKAAWRNAMTKGGEISLDNSVCNQASLPQFDLSSGAEDGAAVAADEQLPGQFTAQVHCIEPMPITAEALSASARTLQWDKRGFVVTHAAIAREDGITPFPSGKSVGKENKGMENCKSGADGVNCVNVDMYSLDTYVDKFLPKDDGHIIDFLSIDVEGFDMDVMLGGSSTLKNRVHYLEFEYNWMGPWKNQKLSESIRLLDEEYNFTCYWPGYDGNIWRITDCWLDYYDLHFWANVACVKRGVKEVEDMAERMEELFQETLEKGSNLVMDFEHRGVTYQYGRTS